MTHKEEDIYGDLDPWDLFSSSLALGIVSGISWEELWFAINLSEDAEQFDAAVWATCELGDIVKEHSNGKT